VTECSEQFVHEFLGLRGVEVGAHEHELVVGDKGRVVVPAEVREARGWVTGTTLIGVETSKGLLLMSRDEARRMVREQLGGRDVAQELIDERHAEARREDTEATAINA